MHLWVNRRKQFSRYGYALTPACGRKVRAFGPTLATRLKPGPSGSCHSRVFTPYKQEFENTLSGDSCEGVDRVSYSLRDNT